MRNTMRGRVVGAVAGLLCCAGVALGQGAGGGGGGAGGKKREQAAPAAVRRTTLLAFETAPVDLFIVDAKDANLKAALLMLPRRLGELRQELPGGEQIPKELVGVLEKIMGKGARVSLEVDAGKQQQSRFGVHVVVSLGFASEAEARAVGSDVEVLRQIGAGRNGPVVVQSAGYPTMQEYATPAGVVRWGPRQSATGWRYEVHFGSPRVDEQFASMAGMKLGGVQVLPSARAMVDPAALESLVGLAGMMGAPVGPQVAQQMAQAGYFGENALKVVSTSGYSESASVSEMRIENAKKHLDALGMSEATLTAEQLRIIPLDAMFGSISTWSAQAMVAQIAQLEEAMPAGMNPFDIVRRETGVDLMKDVVGEMGSVRGSYAADSTGGAGLLSVVSFVSVKDAAKLRGTMDKLASKANETVAEMIRGATGRPGVYVKVQSFDWRGQKVYALRFPGLPVPIEVCVAVTDQWMFMGLTPQAVMGAIDQAVTKDAGFMASPTLAVGLPKGGAVVSVSFNDVTRTARDGYGLLTLVGSGMGNLVRSPLGDAREPGVMVPTYRALMKNARPTVSIGRFDGDTLVVETTADRSMLVNTAASLGEASVYTPLAVAAIGGVGAAVAANEREMPWNARPVPRAPQGGPEEGGERKKRPNY